MSKSSGEAATLFGWDGDVLAFESTQSKSAIEEGGGHGWSVHYVHEGELVRAAGAGALGKVRWC